MVQKFHGQEIDRGVFVGRREKNISIVSVYWILIFGGVSEVLRAGVTYFMILDHRPCSN